MQNVDKQPSRIEIEKYLPMVRRVVRSVQNRVPGSVDRDSLLGAGLLGLVQAFQGFDADKGVTFETYARIRIRGALQDELRQHDHLTRGQRRRERTVRETRDQLDRSGSTSDDLAVAEMADVSVEDVRRTSHYASAPRAMDPAVMGEMSFTPLWQEHLNAEASLIHAQRLSMVRNALEKLPERERMIMSLYYQEELTLQEIGDILGVTQSRVSQIVGRIKKKLFAKLADA